MENKIIDTEKYNLQKLLSTAIHLGYYDRPNAKNVLKKIEDSSLIKNLMPSDQALWATYRLYLGIFSPEEVLKEYLFNNDKLKGIFNNSQKEVN